MQWIKVGVTIGSMGVFVLTASARPHRTLAQAAGPSVKVMAPTAGQKITDNDLKVSTQVSNYKVDCSTVGQPDRPGQGHIHAMLDGSDMAVLTNFYCEPNFTISGAGIKPGKHTLEVILASDTHADVGQPVKVDFDFEPAQAKPLPAAATFPSKPSVKITGPADKASTGPKFNLNVQTSNLNLSCDLEGKGNIQGYGHLHIFVDLDMEAMMAAMQSGQAMSMAGLIAMPCAGSIPVDLSAWGNGPHTIVAQLVNDDHTELEGIDESMITVNLQGSPGSGRALAPRMPSTGSGGLLDNSAHAHALVQDASHTGTLGLSLGIAGALVVLLSLSGAFAYRARRRS